MVTHPPLHSIGHPQAIPTPYLRMFFPQIGGYASAFDPGGQTSGHLKTLMTKLYCNHLWRVCRSEEKTFGIPIGRKQPTREMWSYLGGPTWNPKGC
jgi:hypothetical protein